MQLDKLSMIELFEILEDDAVSNEVKQHVVVKINRLANPNSIIWRYRRLYAKVYNSTTTVEELKLLKVQCSDYKSICENVLTDPDADTYAEKFGNLSKEIETKLQYRIDKNARKKPIPEKLEEVLTKLHNGVDGKEGLNGMVWSCSLETLLNVFNFSASKEMSFSVLSGKQTIFYYLLHKLFDYLEPEVSKYEFFRVFLIKYFGTIGSFRRCKNISTCKEKRIIDAILC